MFRLSVWVGLAVLIAALIGLYIATNVLGTLPESIGAQTLDVSELKSDAGVSNKDALSLPSTAYGQASAYNSWMLPTLLAMSLALIVAVATSFYLYRWRRILIAEPSALVPEEWGGVLRNFGTQVEAHTSSLRSWVENFNRHASDSSKQISNLVDTFMTLQKALDEKDAEIRRLKGGYDAAIYDKFLYRFIRVDQSLRDIDWVKGESPDRIAQTGRLMEDALDDCGVEVFEPSIGSDYRKSQGVADNPKTMKTDRPEDSFKIVEIVEPGYRRKIGDGYEVIVPAKVKILTSDE